jgi:pyrroline-5-carboxylate reductase
MKFGVIGFGNMGGAIVRGAVNKGTIRKEDVYVYDILESARDAAKEFGLNVLGSDEEVAAKSDVVLLAVKPQQMLQATADTKKALEGKGLFSIVAGVTVERLRAAIDANPRILRIMPNTPALVYEGAFALCQENDLTDEEKKFADNLFSSIGIVLYVKEYDIDAVCGLSGGGPAYVAMFIEGLADGGVKQGLKRDVAYKLAAQTVMGTAKMILDLGMHPGQLKDMVTSPAGTTIEGCEVLEQNSFRYAAMKAVVEATNRSREL